MSFNPFTAAGVKEVLPALRLMVRYPTKATTIVSFETEVELAHLNQFIAKRGRPTKTSLPDLEAEAAGREPTAGGVGPEEEEEETSATRPVPAAPRLDVGKALAAQSMHGRAAEVAATVRPADEPIFQASARSEAKFRADAYRKYREVLTTFLVSEETLYKIATSLDVSFSGVCSFLRTHFGSDVSVGTLTRPTMKGFVAWCDGKAGMGPQPPAAPSAKPAPTPAPAAVAKPVRAPAPIILHAPFPDTPKGTIEIKIGADMGAVPAAISALWEKYAGELAHLKKQSSGLERAIDIAAARVEVADEICALLAKGGAAS